MMSKFAAALLLMLPIVTAHAFAQSSPNFTPQQVPTTGPTATQWNSYFAGKVDTIGGVMTNPTINGTVNGSFTFTNNPGYVGSVTDGRTTISPATSMTFSGATVSVGGNGNVVVTVPTMALQPYIYAALAPYNVEANGLDQTVAIQNALQAAAPAGSAVILPVGNIIVNASGLNVPSGVTLAGSNEFHPYLPGSSQSILGTVLTSPNSTYSGATTPILTMNQASILTNLTVWGSGTSFGFGTGRTGVVIVNRDVRLDHVSVFNNAIGVQANTNNVTIENSNISQNVIGIASPQFGRINSNEFISNQTDMEFLTSANGNVITGNHFSFNGSGPSILVDGSGVTSTAVTNNTTPAGNNTLHFASGPPGGVQGYQVYDQTTPSAIPLGTYVTQAAPGTSMTLSANATGAGVGVADVIEFYLPGVADLTFAGNQFQRCATNCMQIKYAQHVSVVGSNFISAGALATANTSDDAAIYLSHSNLTNITGTITSAGQDGTTPPYSPSWGFWDAGANYAGNLTNNSIMYNRVDGANGGGINVTTTFSSFNTSNVIVLANPYQVGSP